MAAPERVAVRDADTTAFGPRSSYHQVLRVTSIVAGGRIATVAIGLIRTKLLALLLGPAGVGYAALLQGVMISTATLFGLGLSSSSVRQVAAAGANPGEVAVVRRALWRASLVLGLLGAVALIVGSAPLARLVFQDVSRAGDVAWLGAGAMLSVIAACQTALLQGLRRIGDMMKASVLGMALGTAAGVAIIAAWGHVGIRWFVLAGPAAAAVTALWYVRRLPHVRTAAAPTGAIWPTIREMARLGIFLMLSVLVAEVAALAARSLLTARLGVEAAGQFHAVHVISTTYLGFVLAAMAADYYPRLTGIFHDPDAVGRVVNDQLEIALLLVAPLLLGLLAFAPWALRLLYSAEFVPGADIMRLQFVGDVFKLGAWALAFVILAAGAGRTFLLAELTAQLTFLAALFLLVPYLGLLAAGVAFMLQYALYLPLVWWLVRRRTGFTLRTTCRVYLVGLTVASAVVAAAGVLRSDASAAVLGVGFAAAAGAWALHVLYRNRAQQA